MEGRLGPHQARQAALRSGGRVAPAHPDLQQPQAPRPRRLLRAVDLRLRHADQLAADGHRARRAAEVDDHRQGHGDPLGRQLGRRPRRHAPSTATRTRCSRASRTRWSFEFEKAFMFYLPRICEHCLNPSCVASCPSGAMYKRSEDGIVLVDQDRCRGWRMCVSGCPYKKVYFNHRTGKAEKCTLCYPRIEVGQPTVCSETCVGRLRYLGLFLYDADKVMAAASVENEQDLYEAQLDLLLDPNDPEVDRAGTPRRHRRRLDRGGAEVAGLRAREEVPPRAAAAPGVPHHADGLVHPAAVARGRRAGQHRSRRRGQGQPVRAPSRRCASRSATSPTS